MPLIDERGRVFGRLNLVDAALVVLMLLMVPVAYGAYLLFRDPPARLTSISPTQFNEGPNLQVYVHGENFRPYMRVSFGTQQGTGFLFQSPTTAATGLPQLPAGKYDVVLYDYTQEVSRLKDALTILSPVAAPETTVAVAGVFTGLSAEASAKLTKGLKLIKDSDAAVILDVNQPQAATTHVQVGAATLEIPANGLREVPATLSLRCALVLGPDGVLRCAVSGVILGPEVNVAIAALDGTLNFRVSEVHYVENAKAIPVSVRFPIRPGLRPDMAVGDRDISAKSYPSGIMATIVSIGASSVPGMRDVLLSVTADQTPTGWKYKGQPLKAGSALTFETLRYTNSGTITNVELEGAKP